MAVKLFEENNKAVIPDQPSLSDTQVDNIVNYIKETGSAQEQLAEKQRLEAEAVAQSADHESDSFIPPISDLTYGDYFLLSGFGFALLVLFYSVLTLNRIVRIRA